MRKNNSTINGIRLLVTLIAFFATVSSLTIVSASQPAYMWVTGDVQGDIEGSTTEAGKEGAIKIYAMEQEVRVPTDEQGRPTGRQVNGPLKVVKEYDKATPLLQKALSTGERLSEVELRFYRVTPSGAEEHYYTVKLENALVVSIKPFSSNDSSIGKRFEEVSFSYDKIRWTWEPEGISSLETPESAPFSITIEPKKASVNPGDSIKYKMRIDAQEGFEEPIDLSLKIESLIYSKKHDLGTQYPPYPKEFEYTVKVPSNVPVGVTADGILKAVSGDHVQEEKVTLSIKGSMPGFEVIFTIIGLTAALILIKKSR